MMQDADFDRDGKISYQGSFLKFNLFEYFDSF